MRLFFEVCAMFYFWTVRYYELQPRYLGKHRPFGGAFYSCASKREALSLFDLFIIFTMLRRLDTD